MTKKVFRTFKGVVMRFSSEPTARGDEVAEYVRDYYEAHRELWIHRLWKTWRHSSDEFMLRFLSYVEHVLEAEHSTRRKT